MHQARGYIRSYSLRSQPPHAAKLPFMNNTSIESKPPLILIVDDEELVLRAICMMMEQSGYRVKQATNGEQALAIYTKEQPDIVLLDARMPVMDGFTCCAQLQSLPEAHHAPVLMITGLDDKKSVNRAFEAGAADYITKPIHWAVLLQRVRRLLEQSQLYRQLQQANQTLEIRVAERTTELEQTIKQLEIEIAERQRAETAVKQAEAEVRQALKTEKELNLLKFNLINTVSHEFRTPLTIIETSTSLLERQYLKWDEHKRAKYFDKIHNNINRIVQVLENTLTINKIESGGFEFNPAPMNLTNFCKEVVSQWELAETNQHLITFATEGEPNSRTCVDANLFRIILTHLISNAIRYSPQGGNILFKLLYEQNAVIIRIQDEGIGIPAADIRQLFNKFYRASNANDIPGTPGAGLGLTIVKKAVELHGGNITVESEIGKGTKFTVSIPLIA